MRITLIIVFISFFIISSCNKKSLPDQLPAITTDGNKTFGCIINGNIAYAVKGNPVSNGGGWNINCYSGLFARFNHGSFTISTYNCPANTYQFTIDIGSTLIQTGTFKLGQILLDSSGNELSNHLTVMYADDKGTYHWYQTDSLHTGQLIMLRASDSIFSGTFSAQLEQQGTNDICTITSGRFDVKLN